MRLGFTKNGHGNLSLSLSPIHFLLIFPQCTIGCSRHENDSHVTHVTIHRENLRDLRKKLQERINIHKKIILAHTST